MTEQQLPSFDDGNVILTPRHGHMAMAGRADPLVPIDVTRLVETRLLVQANSGGGKTWANRRLLEQTYGLVQHIVIDPEGEMHTLREKFDYVLAAPKGGDCPADLKSAPLLARKLLELGASAIIDIYDLGTQRARFVKLFLESLMNAPREMWQPVLVLIEEAHKFCLDDETEILTESGWRRHDKIAVGDVVVAFDVPNGSYRYEQITDVIRKQHNGKMVSLQSDGIDCLVTPEHRVVMRRMQRGKGRVRLYDWTFCQADRVPVHSYVPIGGAPVGTGVAATDDLLRLIGWVATDGCFTGGSRRRKYLGISQSHVTKKRGLSMVAELDVLLSRLHSVGRYERPIRKVGDKTSAASVDYYLGSKLSRDVLAWTGHDIHRIPRTLITGCSKSQLELLLQGLLEGDGSARGDSWTTFYPGKNEGLADDFQEIALRLGISSSKRFIRQSGQWKVTLSRRPHHYIRRPRSATYSGIVWCVTLPSGAFVVRRRGKVFVTGNCPERGEGEAESTEAVKDLMTRGRKRGYCGVLSTQRLSALHKSAAAECNNRLIGRTALDVDQDRAAKVLGFDRKRAQSLAELDDGHFYAFGPALCKQVTEIKIGTNQTTHEKAGQRRKGPTPPRERVRQMLAQLADLPHEAEAEAKTIEALTAKVRELEGRIRSEVSRPKLEYDPALKEENVKLREHAADLHDRFWAAVRIANAMRTSMDEATAKLAAGTPMHVIEVCVENEVISKGRPRPLTDTINGSLKTNWSVPVAPVTPATSDAGTGSLSNLERAMLTSLAQHWGGLTKKQMLVHTGYSSSGDVSKAFGRFGREGWTQFEAGIMTITDAGRSALGSWEPLPMGGALRAQILASSKLSKVEKAIFSVVCDAYPGDIGKGVVLTKAGYSSSGDTSKAFGKMVTLGYFTKTGSGRVKASEELFNG